MKRSSAILNSLSLALVLAAVGCGGSGQVSTIETKATAAAYPESSIEPKPESATVSPMSVPSASTKIVDQTDTVRSGPSKYWYEKSGLGYNNNMTYTYVNGSSTSNSMLWKSGLGAGTYDFQAYIPHNYATTRSAQYRVGYISSGTFNQIQVVSVNQYAISDAFVDLGKFNCKGEPAVVLGDDTGEAYSTKRVVGFDAISFTSVNQAADLNAFVQKYTNQKVGDGQCVALARFWAQTDGQSIPGHNACDYAGTNPPGWKWIPNTPSGVPVPGDLVVWDHKSPADSKYGHIDIFVSGDVNKFNGFDQNWPANSKCHLVSHTYKSVLGWLHRTP